MGLAGLDAALAGLRVSQQQLSVISGNIANVGTPGYSRQILPQSTVSVEGRTVGVRAETIIRNVNLDLQRDLFTQVSAVGFLDVQQTFLGRVEQFHGPPDAELSFAADIARLRDSFSALGDSPDDAFLQSSTVNQAIDTANKINDFADLLNTLRNDVQDEIRTSVERVNGLLVQIADLNDQIQDNLNVSRTTATLEDQRDSAITELSGLIEVSFFQRGDGVLVVQTNQGVELASERPEQLFFRPTPLSESSFYPDSINGIFIGDPSNPSSVDITDRTPGGSLEGLLTLRDSTFPRQSAQLDEFAYRTAQRLESQGLTLFTGATGTIPADTAPDPTTIPPTPVPYVGFASVFQVNQEILDDNTLVQNGTSGATVGVGSNEVIRRILEFGFGSVEFQQAENLDLLTQVDLLNTGGLDLQALLGLPSSNTLESGRDLSAFANVGGLVTSANGALDDPNDQFQITFEEPRTGLGPVTITVDLSVADAAPGATAIDQIVNHINTEITAAGLPAGLTASASVGNDGQLILNTSGSFNVDSNFGPTGIGNAGLIFLGIADNNGVPTPPTDPFFDIEVGNNDPVRIFIDPGDTSVELINKLQAVPGVAVDTVNFALDGVLRVRPGNDFDIPDFGGDLRITSGPFTTNGAAYGAPPATTVRTAIDNGVNIASALFGTYTLSGTAVINESPVRSVEYQSETNASLPLPIPTAGFRSEFLGPAANLATNIASATTLVNFAQSVVNEQSQSLILTTARIDDEQSLQEALETQFLNESGVNLDEELGNLIVVQTAFSASARVLTAIDELFQELLRII